MDEEGSRDVPQSPEVQEDYVKDELDQDQVTHQGDWREAPAQQEVSGKSKHLGAVDDEVVPIVPPMAGPADVVGEHDVNAQGNENDGSEDQEELFDPYDHITPG